MRPLALALGLFTLLATVENSPAAQPPIKVLKQPSVSIPPEAATTAAGGPAVVLAEKVTPPPIYEMLPGGPCGGGMPYDSGMTDFARSASGGGQPAGESGGIGLWLPVGSAVAGVAGLALIGFWLVRRSRV